MTDKRKQELLSEAAEEVSKMVNIKLMAAASDYETWKRNAAEAAAELAIIKEEAKTSPDVMEILERSQTRREEKSEIAKQKVEIWTVLAATLKA